MKNINIQINASFNLDDGKILRVELNPKKNNYNIYINGLSAIHHIHSIESMLNLPITDYTCIPEWLTKTLLSLGTQKSVKPDECVAVLSAKKYKSDMPNIITYNEYCKLDPITKKSYDIITPPNETIYDKYLFICRILKSGLRNLKELSAHLTLQSDTEETFIEFKTNTSNPLKTESIITRNIYKNEKHYTHLRCTDLKEFDKDWPELEQLRKLIKKHSINKKFLNWNAFEVPVYICKLKNISNTNQPYLQTFFNKEDIEKEYEIFHVIKLPHESYIKELSNYGTTQTSTLDVCDIITELITHISKLKEF